MKDALVKRSERFAAVNEVKHDQTHQRRFERAFLSLDWRDEDGDAFDYGDCGSAAKKLYAALDAPFRKRRREFGNRRRKFGKCRRSFRKHCFRGWEK